MRLVNTLFTINLTRLKKSLIKTINNKNQGKDCQQLLHKGLSSVQSRD